MYKDKLETFNQKVMEHESTHCGNFVRAHVFAVWPGPHALTTRVKRCGHGHTGFRRCCQGHTKESRLSSGVAGATRIEVSILYPGSLGTVSGRFYPPRVFAVWPGPHALTTRVTQCEPAHTGFRRCWPAHTKQGCLSSGVVWPAPHALTPRVEIGSFPAPQNVENYMYCHAFHYAWGSKNMGYI